MNIKDVKKEFVEKGQKVLRYELDAAIGAPSQLHGGMINKEFHPKIVSTMLELIKADNDIQKIQCKNTADVLRAISNGEISISDAKEMVVLLALINGESNVPEDQANKIIIEIATNDREVKDGGSEQ